MTLGEKIKHYRKMEGLSQDALAEKLNVSRQAITKWENNNGVPDIDNLVALSKLMGTSIDKLVMGENEESVSAISKDATNQSKRNSTIYLFVAIAFSFAAVCWIISCILNIIKGNILAAVLNAICVAILILPISLYFLKYYDTKKQKKD